MAWSAIVWTAVLLAGVVIARRAYAPLAALLCAIALMAGLAVLARLRAPSSLALNIVGGLLVISGITWKTLPLLRAAASRRATVATP